MNKKILKTIFSYEGVKSNLKGQDIIKFIAKTLPNQPGVYQMEDNEGNPLSERRNHLDFCRDEKIYAKFPKDRCAWMLNSYRAWHGIDENPTPTGSRITCAIIGEYDKDKLFQLLDASTEKHKEYQIWY